MTRLVLAPKLHSRRLRLWMLALALSMLASVSLGQLHAVQHANKHHCLGGHGVGQHAEHAHDDAHEDAHGDSHDDGFIEKLFSNHSEGEGCRLYDQLRDGHAMPVVVAVFVAAALPSVLVAVFEGEALARWVAPFDARGPPLTA